MTTPDPKIADAAVDNLNDTMSAAQNGIGDAFNKLREAIVAERVAPHPAQQRADGLEKLLRQTIGRIHAAATSANNRGAYHIGSELRRFAQQTSTHKAEILGDAPPHQIDVDHECGLIVVSCVCGWAARTSFPDEPAARRYGDLHLESAGVASNGSKGGKKK